MPLSVHIDLPKDDPSRSANNESVIYAKTDHGASVMKIYADGSRDADRLGYAAVWKDPTARDPARWEHEAGKQVAPASIRGSDLPEEELRALALALQQACTWHRPGVTTILAFSDCQKALRMVRDWVEEEDGDEKHRQDEAFRRLSEIFRKIKDYAECLHMKGIAVTLRWLKARSFVDGHDIADVWARWASGAGYDSSEYKWRHNEIGLMVNKQEREDRADPEMTAELASLERELRQLQ